MAVKLFMNLTWYWDRWIFRQLRAIHHFCVRFPAGLAWVGVVDGTEEKAVAAVVTVTERRTSGNPNAPCRTFVVYGDRG